MITGIRKRPRPRGRNFEALKGKIVRFRYLGGSTPGGERIVRVEEVKYVKGVPYLVGLDLENPDLAEGRAFRQYDTNKAVGYIRVIN